MQIVTSKIYVDFREKRTLFVDIEGKHAYHHSLGRYAITMDWQ